MNRLISFSVIILNLLTSSCVNEKHDLVSDVEKVAEDILIEEL
jgi:hypothetical protein